jgi:VWFA-related protein
VRGAPRFQVLRVAASVAVAALADPAATAAGRGPSPPAAQAPGIEHALSELVQIEVHAVDPRGRPVRGLTAADFTLRVDGRPAAVPIASFEEIDTAPAAAESVAGGSAAGVPGQGPPGAPPAATPTPAGPAPASVAKGDPSGIPPRTILFFEDAESMPWNMSAARVAARRLLRSLPPGPAQFALTSYDDHRGLRILHDFTADRDALIETLRASERDHQRMSGVDSVSLRAETLAGGQSTPESMAHEDYHHLSRALSCMRALVEGLSSWPGRKAVLYMGDGVPMNPGRVFHIEDSTLDLGPDLNALAGTAAAAGVVLDAVQTSGIGAGADETWSWLRAEGLSGMTLDTGGRKFVTNDLHGALAAIESSAHHYYLVGYAPQGPPDGRPHGLILAVSRPGVTLRYRTSFTRFTAEETRARLVRAAFVTPEMHADLGLDVAVFPGPAAEGDRPAAKRDRFVDLVVYMPSSGLLFVPRPGGTAAAALEIGISALDTKQRESVRVARRLDALLDAATRSRGGIEAVDIAARLSLPAGPHEITVVVSDLGSGRIGATRVRIAAAGQSATGAPDPALYAASERSLWIRMETGAPGESSAVTATRIGPALRTRFSQDEQVLVGFWRPAAGSSHVGRLVIRRGASVVRNVAADPAAPAGEGAGGPLHASLSLAGLEAGEYTLGLDTLAPPDTPDHADAPAEFLFRIVPAPAAAHEVP